MQNFAVYAIACVALLFAEQGKPAEELDEDQFFAVVGALICGRARRRSRPFVANRDVLAVSPGNWPKSGRCIDCSTECYLEARHRRTRDRPLPATRGEEGR